MSSVVIHRCYFTFKTTKSGREKAMRIDKIVMICVFDESISPVEKIVFARFQWFLFIISRRNCSTNSIWEEHPAIDLCVNALSTGMGPICIDEQRICQSSARNHSGERSKGSTRIDQTHRCSLVRENARRHQRRKWWNPHQILFLFLNDHSRFRRMAGRSLTQLCFLIYWKTARHHWIWRAFSLVLLTTECLTVSLSDSICFVEKDHRWLSRKGQWQGESLSLIHIWRCRRRG